MNVLRDREIIYLFSLFNVRWKWRTIRYKKNLVPIHLTTSIWIRRVSLRIVIYYAFIKTLVVLPRSYLKSATNSLTYRITKTCHIVLSNILCTQRLSTIYTTSLIQPSSVPLPFDIHDFFFFYVFPRTIKWRLHLYLFFESKSCTIGNVIRWHIFILFISSKRCYSFIYFYGVGLQ